MKTKPSHKGLYNRLIKITIVAVYLLILAGGIVRSTGSGMGCPDWPHCFGSWVPPLSVAQLPANYQETYAQQRVEKNHRLAAYLDMLGFQTTAQALRAESLAAPESVFNAGKTWTEYINRLMGVMVGFLIIGVLVISRSFRKIDPPIFYGSLVAFLLVVFQGWIGSVVVSTNLLPGVVTFHMALALVMLCLLIYLFHRSRPGTERTLTKGQARPIKALLVLSITALMIQISLGTQVREAIDMIALQFQYLLRDRWVEQLGSTFYVHRSFSLLILGLQVYLYLLLKRSGHPEFQFWSLILMALIVAEVLLGTYMVYFAIPQWAQPVHLVCGTLIIGLQFWLYLRIKQPQKL